MKCISRKMQTAENRDGFTSIELIVVVAAVAVLVALLLPAVQRVREGARRTTCQNHLRQIGAAIHAFESAHRSFPSNGWGYLWIGEPDRGAGPRQPGGWIYQLLPYTEAQNLAQIGQGETSALRYVELSSLVRQPLPVFRCPSRPGNAVSIGNLDLRFHNAFPRRDVAKTDYAINEGDFITNTGPGPPTLSEGDGPTYDWEDVRKASGISYLRSVVRVAHVRDGMSQTYMVGEKYVSNTGYHDGSDLGHDAPMYCGVDLDINRWTIDPPGRDSERHAARSFGSAHDSGCFFVMCDGGVRAVSYSIDGQLHRNAGTRSDAGHTNALP